MASYSNTSGQSSSTLKMHPLNEEINFYDFKINCYRVAAYEGFSLATKNSLPPVSITLRCNKRSSFGKECPYIIALSPKASHNNRVIVSQRDLIHDHPIDESMVEINRKKMEAKVIATERLKLESRPIAEMNVNKKVNKEKKNDKKPYYYYEKVEIQEPSSRDGKDSLRLEQEVDAETYSDQHILEEHSLSSKSKRRKKIQSDSKPHPYSLSPPPSHRSSSSSSPISRFKDPKPSASDPSTHSETTKIPSFDIAKDLKSFLHHLSPILSRHSNLFIKSGIDSQGALIHLLRMDKDRLEEFFECLNLHYNDELPALARIIFIRKILEVGESLGFI